MLLGDKSRASRSPTATATPVQAHRGALAALHAGCSSSTRAGRRAARRPRARHRDRSSRSRRSSTRASSVEALLELLARADARGRAVRRPSSSPRTTTEIARQGDRAQDRPRAHPPAAPRAVREQRVPPVRCACTRALIKLAGTPPFTVKLGDRERRGALASRSCAAACWRSPARASSSSASRAWAR